MVGSLPNNCKIHAWKKNNAEDMWEVTFLQILKIMKAFKKLKSCGFRKFDKAFRQ